MNLKELKLESKAKTVDYVFNNQKITVKQYIPIKVKNNIAASISATCIEENNKIINKFKKNVILTFCILKEYADIEIDLEQELDNLYEQYDSVISSGLYKSLLDQIPEKEFKELNDYIDSFLNQIVDYGKNVMPFLERLIDIFAIYGSVLNDNENKGQEIINSDKEEMIEENS